MADFPLSAEPVDQINTDMVLRDLLPLPARQRQDVRMWLAALLDFTKGQKWRTWDPDEGNPAKFENERRGMWPKFKKSGNHHAALPGSISRRLWPSCRPTNRMRREGSCGPS